MKKLMTIITCSSLKNLNLFIIRATTLCILILGLTACSSKNDKQDQVKTSSEPTKTVNTDNPVKDNSAENVTPETTPTEAPAKDITSAETMEQSITDQKDTGKIYVPEDEKTEEEIQDEDEEAIEELDREWEEEKKRIAEEVQRERIRNLVSADAFHNEKDEDGNIIWSCATANLAVKRLMSNNNVDTDVHFSEDIVREIVDEFKLSPEEEFNEVMEYLIARGTGRTEMEKALKEDFMVADMSYYNPDEIDWSACAYNWVKTVYRDNANLASEPGFEDTVRNGMKEIGYTAEEIDAAFEKYKNK